MPNKVIANIATTELKCNRPVRGAPVKRLLFFGKNHKTLYAASRGSLVEPGRGFPEMYVEFISGRQTECRFTRPKLSVCFLDDTRYLTPKLKRMVEFPAQRNRQ